MRRENLTLRDAKGLVRAWIGQRDGQVQVELRDQAGKRRLALGLSPAGDPRLSFYNSDQKLVAQIVPQPNSRAGIELLNQEGQVLAAIPPANPSATSPSSPATPQSQELSPAPAPAVPEDSKSVHSPEPTSEPNPVEPLKANTAKLFVTSPNDQAYHRPTCSLVKDIPPDKLLKFSSDAEAAKAGLQPCQHCRPDLPEHEE